MEIKSNTFGKLQKIRDGKVFSEPLTFVKEFIQNCQRSKASILNINIKENYIEFIDNGCGCKKPANLFTLDLSDWDSTTEGFGIGFWSCLNVPGLKEVEVTSFNWTGKLNIENLFSNNDLSVNMINHEKKDGFSVRLYSSYFKDNEFELRGYIVETAKYIDKLYVSINSEASILHEKILDSFNPYGYYKIYDNRYFSAKLALEDQSMPYIETYYDKRKVQDFYNFEYISGVLEFKKDKITLKEPDRTSLVRDSKYWDFREKLEECIKDFYKSYISLYGIDNEDAINGIARYVSVKDFEKYLNINLEEDISKIETSKKESIIIENDNNQSNIAAKQNTSQITIEKEDYNMPNKITNNYFYVPEISNCRNIKTQNISKLMPQLKKCVWVSLKEEEYYKELIAKAKYCNIKVIIAKNKLYEMALRNRNIMHISSINECLKEVIIKKNITLKTSKEEVFIKLLQPICEKYNLPLDTFKIANLEKITTFSIDGKVLYKESLKNKKGDIKTYGLTDHINVYLDRTALELSRFNIHEGNVGLNEIKALMNAINTIAHELSHYLYNTTDNTVEHYNKEIKLQEEIIKLYI